MYNLPGSCLVLFFLISLFHPQPCASSKLELSDKTLFQCGNITAGFPFWGGNRPKYCGHPLLKLHCNKNSRTSLHTSDQEYSVFHLNQTSYTLKLARTDLLGSICSSTFTNIPLPPQIFELSPAYKSVAVPYRCYPDLYHSSSYKCPEKVSENPGYHETCHESFTVNVPKSFVLEEKDRNLAHLESVLRKGFEVKVKIDEKACQECLSSHGRCGFNESFPFGFKCRPLPPPTGQFLAYHYHFISTFF